MIFNSWAVKPKVTQTIATEKYVPTDAMYLKGMEFERWIDYTNGNTRSNGYNAGDLIENPAYVIESILRDWTFCERNRRIDTSASGTKAVLDGSVYGFGLSSAIDDVYNGSIYYNHKTGHKTYISDYNGTTKEITLAVAEPVPGVMVGSYVSITNIQGDNLIDTASFDAIGNSTNGLRNGYQLAVSLKDLTTPRTVIDEICQNFLLFVFKSGQKYKIATLEKKTTADGTLSNPLKAEGKPLISTWVTSLGSYYSDFSFRHFNEYQKNEYLHIMECSANGSTSGLGTTYEGYCKTANEQYRQGVRKLEKDFAYIYNGMDSLPTTGTTMHNIAKLLIRFYTKLRLMVEYYGDFKNHMKYEIGDQVKINYSSMIPTGLNNSAFFLITGKAIESVNGIPTVRLTLMETFEL